jgi:hypothetical protein
MDFGIQCLYRPQNCPAVMLELSPTHLCAASSSSTAQLNDTWNGETVWLDWLCHLRLGLPMYYLRVNPTHFM